MQRDKFEQLSPTTRITTATVSRRQAGLITRANHLAVAINCLFQHRRSGAKA